MSLLSQIKNILGKRINPATEATLANIESQTDKISSQIGADTSYLNVKVMTPSVLPFTNTTKDLATQSTLADIATKTSTMVFDSTNSLTTTGVAPALASSVNVKDQTTANVSPLNNEGVILWRRIARLMESQEVVDANNCQRVTIDGFVGDIVYGTGPSVANVPLVTAASDYFPTLAGITNSTTFIGHNSQKYVDAARVTYNKIIRRRLAFS